MNNHSETWSNILHLHPRLAERSCLTALTKTQARPGNLISSAGAGVKEPKCLQYLTLTVTASSLHFLPQPRNTVSLHNVVSFTLYIF